MSTAAKRLRLAEAVAAAESARADLSEVGGEWAIVEGIPCARLPVDYPWAVQAKAMSPPTAGALGAALRWMARWSPGGTGPHGCVVTRRRYADHAVFDAAGLQPALVLSAMVQVDAPDALTVVPDLDIGPARSVEEFRVPFRAFGTDLGPLVTPRHLAAPSELHLVGRLGGAPVACAQIHCVAGTTYVSAVAVLPELRGLGVGTAISAAATKAARSRCAGPVWLHAEAHLHPLYRRLGYRVVDDHVQLRTDTPSSAAAPTEMP